MYKEFISVDIKERKRNKNMFLSLHNGPCFKIPNHLYGCYRLNKSIVEKQESLEIYKYIYN